MQTLFRANPILYVWLVLVGSTIASWLIGTDGVGTADGAIVAVLGVAFLKAWLVGRWFMEIRTAPTWLRGTFDGWALVTSVAVIALYVAA